MTPEKTIKDHEEEYHKDTPITWEASWAIFFFVCVTSFTAFAFVSSLHTPQQEPEASPRLLNIDCGNGSNIIFSHDTSLAHIKEVCHAYATTTYILP